MTGMTYEDFRNPDKWEKQGNEEMTWFYERVIGQCRVTVMLSGNDGIWKWFGEPTDDVVKPALRRLNTYVYDCGGITAEEAFREAYETLFKPQEG